MKKRLKCVLHCFKNQFTPKSNIPVKFKIYVIYSVLFFNDSHHYGFSRFDSVEETVPTFSRS